MTPPLHPSCEGQKHVGVPEEGATWAHPEKLVKSPFLPLEGGLGGVRARGGGLDSWVMLDCGREWPSLLGGPGPSRSPPTHMEACFWFWFCGHPGMGSDWRVVPEGRGASHDQAWAPSCAPLGLQGTPCGLTPSQFLPYGKGLL